MIRGSHMEVALLKDMYIYELSLINPLNLEKILITQSSQWCHELWPLAYNHKRLLICYSASFWGFKTPELGYLDQRCYLRHQKWDEILHWNKVLADYEKNIIKKEVNIHEIGPITPQGRVNCQSKELITRKNKYILVFDCLPYTKFGRICSNLGERYRTNSVCINFIDDIIKEATYSDLDVVIKPKRDIEAEVPYYSTNAYFEMLKKSNNLDNVQVANRDVNIHSLIKDCLLVISAPFTSPTLYASLVYSKPAFYYDPTGKLYKDDRGAMNLEVISGHTELKDLLSSCRK